MKGKNFWSHYNLKFFAKNIRKISILTLICTQESEIKNSSKKIAKVSDFFTNYQGAELCKYLIHSCSKNAALHQKFSLNNARSRI